MGSNKRAGKNKNKNKGKDLKGIYKKLNKITILGVKFFVKYN